MSDEQEWVHDDGVSYDPDRWDPDEKPDKCQECGTGLRGAGDGSTVGQHCPECGVNVWIK